MALVDQMCANADIDIALLDALDYPLGESLSALHDFGIRTVAIHVERRELTVGIELTTPVHDVRQTLGEAREVVESFFDVRRTDRASNVALVGSLG